MCTEMGVVHLSVPCGSVPPPSGECSYEGKTYAPGDSWTCSDGCNTCQCLEDGTVSATERACTICHYDDQDYSVGEIVEIGSGTTCICLENGEVGHCTGVILDDGGPNSPSAALTSDPSDGGASPSDDRAYCQLPPDSGDCEAAFPAIYFDAASGQCKQFTWGGCGGNANRFDNLSDCYAACGADAF